ncbi:MAG: lipid A biosynthesis acyltransferase [Proteobacteria bacterium]|nr:lipid A biosynthesis acyltransferase [Pseudomonadota bacterium]
MSQSWLNQQERGSFFSIKLIIAIARIFGRRFATLFLYPICLYFILFCPSAVRASRNYLSRVLDCKPHIGHVFRHLFTFSQTLLDRVYLYTGNQHVLQIRRFGEEAHKLLDTRETGVFYIGAHMGSFDAAQVFGSSDLDIRVHMLMYEENADKFRQVRTQLDKSDSISVIPLGKADTMIRAKEAVDRGEDVAILGDRQFGGGKDVRVRFLGGYARFPLGPFIAASVLKVPVLFFVALYRGGNVYEGHFEVLAEKIETSRKTREQDLQAWVQLYAERLEYYCRMAPYNWFNFYDFWESDDEQPVANGDEQADSQV